MPLLIWHSFGRPTDGRMAREEDTASSSLDCLRDALSGCNRSSAWSGKGFANEPAGQLAAEYGPTKLEMDSMGSSAGRAERRPQPERDQDRNIHFAARQT